MVLTTGFQPVAGSDARILVLGSLPGRKSIAVQQYYGHPQNAFWRIMAELYGIEGDYLTRCDKLAKQGIALWDVLHASLRSGSLDADIRRESAEANDFGAFFATQPRLALIAFNGKKAAQLFRQLVPATVAQAARHITLPSTSPAYAAMPFSSKLDAWRDGLSEPSSSVAQR